MKLPAITTYVAVFSQPHEGMVLNVTQSTEGKSMNIPALKSGATVMFIIARTS